jgi:hypothetical protein
MTSSSYALARTSRGERSCWVFAVRWQFLVGERGGTVVSYLFEGKTATIGMAPGCALDTGIYVAVLAPSMCR